MCDPNIMGYNRPPFLHGTLEILMCKPNKVRNHKPSFGMDVVKNCDLLEGYNKRDGSIPPVVFSTKDNSKLQKEYSNGFLFY